MIRGLPLTLDKSDTLGYGGLWRFVIDGIFRMG